MLLLGASRLGQTLRAQVEIRRARPRHGTTRTLSVLTLGCALLATPRHAPRAGRALPPAAPNALQRRGDPPLSSRAPAAVSVAPTRAPPSPPTGDHSGVARFTRVSFPPP